MPTAQLGPLLRHIHMLATGPVGRGRPDHELVDDFTIRRDEAAFAALVSRHGPMVLRVCRRVLSHEQDAEDAFQATFLVLARKARSIRKREAIGSWLHGVAYRIAMSAKRSAARRRKHETDFRAVRLQPDGNPRWDDVQLVLDEEIQRLPRRYREAFVLSVLEGKGGLEAAAELGCREGTVKSRVSRARQFLQARLKRRGIELAALLAALSVAESARAALPAVLAHAAVRSGLLVVTGRTAAATIPAHVATLAAGVTRAMFLTKAKVATAVLLALGLCAGAVLQGHQNLAPPAGAVRIEPKAAPTAKPRAARPPSKRDQPTDAVTLSGRVLGPSRQPVAGAKVYFHFITREDEAMPVRGLTDGQGRFSFTLTRKDVPLSADPMADYPLTLGQVIVKADGFTVAWRWRPKPGAEITLQVARDNAPLEGRILDLQGKPLQGLRVSALGAWASENAAASGLAKALKSGEPFYEACFKHLPNFLGSPIIFRNLSRFLPSATTGSDGRFRLHGFAADQLVELRIEGPAIETQNIHVLTSARPSGADKLMNPPRIRDAGMFGPPERALLCWNNFEHAAPPGQIVAGTVRDAVRKTPIPGAVVESYRLAGSIRDQNTIYQTRADAEGRYRLIGLPRHKGNRIRIRPPEQLPYLPVVKNVPPWDPLARTNETSLDVALERGIWVEVTAKDKATGKPVPGQVSYFVLPEKGSTRPFFMRPFAEIYNDFMATRNDGTFRFAAVPQRRAIVAFRADWQKYPIPRQAVTIRLPGALSPENYQAVADIYPRTDGEALKVDFVLDAGGIVKGKLIGPDGQPVSGALAGNLRVDWFHDVDGPLKTAEFTAIGLTPGGPRLLCFAHLKRKLAGSVVVRAGVKGPVTVRLAPWGTLSGRLLDGEGKPVKNATLRFTEVPRHKPGQPMSLDTGWHVVQHIGGQPSPDPVTDGEGRFHVERLVPGLKHNLALVDERGAIEIEQVKWLGLVCSALVLRPGETKDLGDVRLQPFPKE